MLAIIQQLIASFDSGLGAALMNGAYCSAAEGRLRATPLIDPSTGTHIFSFPRRTLHIEIRAPDGSSAEAKAPAKAQAPPRSSGLHPAASRPYRRPRTPRSSATAALPLPLIY
ncbi:hypothetical protein H0H81_003551 [Sphagnurus paluster]|uniref:Uncharacterized protein n=1 Tax=Sphagnurus paluster TaxID=117069 RepID=A0A9P7FLS8_9AGAR|nr:hypothetical protein H0H81_003551 [Sphagnurus paluster]